MASRVLVFNPRSSQELLHTLQVTSGVGGCIERWLVDANTRRAGVSGWVH
jgi:hypothetical protein